MKKLFVLAATALLLTTVSACEVVKVATQPVDMTSYAQAAYAAKTGYAVALVAAAQIVKMPRCEVAPAPCVPQAVVNSIRNADLAADAATQSAEDLVRTQGSNPSLVKVGVAAATNAVSALTQIVNIYKVK